MIKMGELEIAAATRALRSGNLFRYQYDRKSEVALFEQEWADKIGTRFALGVSNGTAALMCGLGALGIGPGDEVIVPGYTFMATASAVLLCGAIPVIADIDETLLLDPLSIEEHISSRTKAIIPVHMVGMPCDMDAIMRIARAHDLAVIEDACQMDGGSYHGRRVGSIGTIGCFSFNQYKIMSCGEGGALTTNREDVIDRAFVMHDSGVTFRPVASQMDIPVFLGLNFRMNDLAAAVLRAQMSQVDDWLESGRANKSRIVQQLTEAGVTLAPSNDPEGDCGIAVGIQSSTESEILQTQSILRERGIEGWRPFDTERHVYCNWEPILNHNVSHCDGMNPFLHPANQGSQMHYSADMAPRTLDILRRTLMFNLTPFMTMEEIDHLAAMIGMAVHSRSVSLV